VTDPNPIDRSRYQSALALAAARRDDRDNRGDKATHWGTVHALLSKHGPSADGSTCSLPGCGQAWPCATVTGAVTDLDLGSAGW
jgi:hypothetical protein